MEFDIGGRMGARMRQMLFVHVEADDASIGTDQIAHQSGDARGATADVEAAPARRDADAVEHDQRIGRHPLALDAQALDLAGAVFERIVAGEGL